MKWKKKSVYMWTTLAMVGFAIGAWMIADSSTFTGSVTSVGSSPVTVSLDFDDINMDTTSASQMLQSNATINNIDGNLDLTFTVVESWADDLLDSCTDWADDCDLAFFYDGTSFVSDDVISVTSGLHNVTAELTCLRLSCPQHVNVTVSFAE